MILNHEEIKSRKIIDEPIEDEFGNGSYNLTVEKVIDMNNKINDSCTLKPQGMIYVVFKEKLKVPENVIGFAHVKTTLTKLGIMATNIGIIDPNYNGYISTLLINFGKCEHFISKGDAALRVTFANMNTPNLKKGIKQNNLEHASYLKVIQKNISNLDDKFLNLSSVKKEVATDIFKVLLGLAIFFTAGNFALSAYFNHKSSSEKELDSSIKKYELGVLTLTESNKLLEEQLKNYESKLNVLEDSLNAQSALIRKLKK
jgi:deoxycytidine triphosphate deaminase